MSSREGRSVKVFIDFWNVIINARSLTKFEIDLDWSVLVGYLTNSMSDNFDGRITGVLAGCYIFGSYTKSDPRDQNFVNGILDKYGSVSGLFFDFQERVKKDAANRCHHCGGQVSRSAEIGVDVLLTVEMIKHAAMREHDYLVLVSSDRDYLPLLAYLKDKGERVIHAATGENDRRMRSLTWKQIGLSSIFPKFSNIVHQEVVLFTHPKAENDFKSLTHILKEGSVAYKSVDITKKEEISDHDLVFVIANLGLIFLRSSGIFINKQQISVEEISQNVYEFRKHVFLENISGPLPLVMKDGAVEACKRKRPSSNTWYWDVSFGAKIECLAKLKPSLS